MWVTQPSNALVNQVITGSAFTESGTPVTVEVVDSSGGLIKNATGSVTLSQTGTFDSSSCTSAFSGTSATLSGGFATFTSLKSSCSGYNFALTASSLAGYTSSPASGLFGIYATLANCTGGSCGNTGTLGGNGNSGLITSTSGGTFSVLALAGGGLGVTPPGCDNWKGVGTSGFRETDSETGAGTKTFRYFVSQQLIKAKYGKNTGQQLIPICAGGLRVVSGQPVPCQQDINNGGGWWGETLDSTGAFTGVLKQATCNADGLWWGILSSFQDFNNTTATVDWTTNPVVTGWNSCTGNGDTGSCPGTTGATYRYFDIKVPSPWDWNGYG